LLYIIQSASAVPNAPCAKARYGRHERADHDLEDPMLGVWRLQLLRELARRGTVKAAAEAMSVTPSAVSQQLAILEREAGLPLLVRRGRSVQLTAAGAALVRHADQITGAIAEAEAELASLRNVVSGTLAVAAFPTAARTVIPPVIAALGERHPALRLTLRDFEAEEAIPALLNDEIDMAIVDLYEDFRRPVPAGLHAHEFLRDPLFVALPPGGTRTGPVRLADLRDEFWIMDSERSRFFAVTVEACRAAGFEPHIRLNCKDFGVITALVEAGLGVGMLPGLALKDTPVRATICPLDPPLSRSVWAVVRPEKRAHPAIASMLDELDRFGAGTRGQESPAR
jgi:DNA-binding transcriptional LysR family regulator